MSKDIQIKIGSRVQLKSGGPYMTVREINQLDGLIGCNWFAGKNLEGGYFYLDQLDLV